MDPLTQALLAIVSACEATKAVCQVLMTPEGQESMKQWRIRGEEFDKNVKAIGSSFVSVGNFIEKNFDALFNLHVNNSGVNVDVAVSPKK